MSEEITQKQEEPKLNNITPIINNYPINDTKNYTPNDNCKINENMNCNYTINDNINIYPNYQINDNNNCCSNCINDNINCTPDYTINNDNKNEELLKDKTKKSYKYNIILLIISYILIPLMKLILLFLLDIYLISYCFYMLFYY